MSHITKNQHKNFRPIHQGKSGLRDSSSQTQTTWSVYSAFNWQSRLLYRTQWTVYWRNSVFVLSATRTSFCHSEARWVGLYHVQYLMFATDQSFTQLVHLLQLHWPHLMICSDWPRSHHVDSWIARHGRVVPACRCISQEIRVFFTARRYAHSAVFAVARCPSVCLSVTLVHCAWRYRPIILVFWSPAPIPNSKGNPFSRAQNTRGLNISETTQDKAIYKYYRTPIGSHRLSIEFSVTFTDP